MMLSMEAYFVHLYSAAKPEKASFGGPSLKV